MNLTERAEIRKETFHKLTNSADVPDYPASGNRNLAQLSSSSWSTPYTNFNGSANICPQLGKVLTTGMQVGDTVKVRIVLKYDNIVPASGQTAKIRMQGDGNITGWTSGTFPNTSGTKTLDGSGEIVFESSATIDSGHLKNTYWNWAFRTDYIASGSIQWKEGKVEIGNNFTAYSPAPEQLGWTMDTLVPTQSNRYLWKFEYIYYSDGSAGVTQPVNLSIAGANGATGAQGPKGDKGDEGVPGKPGADGRTSYFHMAYADSADGKTGFSFTESGQQYQGYYTDFTQANSTDPTKYTWMDRRAGIAFGTRNLILKSNDFANPHKQCGANTTVTSTDDYFVIKSTGYTANAWGGMSWNMSISEMKVGEEFSILMPVYIDSSIVLDSGLKFSIKNHSKNSAAYDYNIPTNIRDQWFNVAITFKAYNNVVFDTYPFYVYLFRNGLVRIKPPMLVRGNVVPRDHTAAPEDTQEQIDSKADQTLTQDQLNVLAEKSNLIKAEMEAKATIDTVNQWIAAYQNYVKANDADKAKSEQALKDASERILAIRYEVDNLKVVWDAIDTYMSFQNEGLVIGKKDGSAYAKFSDDRISLFSGSSEVMYISQGTLNIANGIFTKTIQIGRFRFETHPADADMLVVRFVGG